MIKRINFMGRSIITLIVGLIFLFSLLGASRISIAATVSTSTPAADSTAEASETLYPLPVLKDGKWGYIDTTGKVVIQPQFVKARFFREGLAAVMVGIKWGYIDTTGKIVIQPQFDTESVYGKDIK